MASADVEHILRQLLHKDLRVQCRARGLSPAGAQDTLKDRLRDHMLATQDFRLFRAEEDDGPGLQPMPANVAHQVADGAYTNNYARPGGAQNLGNFITDKPSSRILAPPGGASQISFGDYVPPAAATPPRMPPPAAAAPPSVYQHAHDGGYAHDAYGGGMPSHGTPQQAYYNQQQQQQHGAAAMSMTPGGSTYATNNYARPGGAQNLGNFITDKPSSRILAPPGGASQISFGDYVPPAPAAAAAPHGYVPVAPAQGYAEPYPPAHAQQQQQQHGAAAIGHGGSPHGTNNYARPGGAQNLGNFITDKPSSRVLAPPGGRSSITFG